MIPTSTLQAALRWMRWTFIRIGLGRCPGCWTKLRRGWCGACGQFVAAEISPRGPCEAVVPRLTAFVLGELEDEQAAFIAEHLEACPECRRVLIVLKYALADLAANRAEDE
jgi:predicted amidophosphoribosyltransferase